MFLNYNLGSKDITIGDIATKVNDGRYHVVRFSRSDMNSTLQVDDNPVHSKYPQGECACLFIAQARACPNALLVLHYANLRESQCNDY